MYGIQTYNQRQKRADRFENDVKMYGIQTLSTDGVEATMFENDVKMYGIQTFGGVFHPDLTV